MLRKQHLIDANGSRAWPLDDSSSTASDDGVLLPPELLVDAHLRYPVSLGKRPFLSALSLTSTLVTVVIETTHDDDSPGTAIASLSVRRTDAAKGTPLAVTPFLAGVGGWLTFGTEVLDAPSASYRFSSPKQSLLSPRCVRPYRPPPVTSLAKLYSTPLTDVVGLRGIGSVTVDAEEREIEGILRDALVMRLRNRDEAATATASINRLSDFTGRCGGRPESRTCGDPEPVEYISSVSPDCDGVLTIEFTGCAEIARLIGRCGVFVSCNVGLGDVCRDPYVPDAQGRLPGEYDHVEIPDKPVEPPIEPGLSEAPGTPPELPYIECFDDGIADDFVVESGDFGFESTDSPDEICPGLSEGASEVGATSISYASTGSSSASVRNVAVWNGADITTFYRRFTTTFKIGEGPTGARHNGGVVVNFHPHPTIAGRHTYWLGEIDCDDSVFRLRRWNGTAFATISSVVIPALTVGDWCKIQATVIPDLDVGQPTITLQLDGISDPTLSATLGPIFISNYGASNGLFGFGTDRSYGYFSWFKVEEAP